jgi:hypothetical protein
MIREYRASDEPILRAIHESQGHPYPFPDLSHPQFVGIVVETDENDSPVQAIAARKTVEVYMLGDPNWRTPAWRMRAFYGLHVAIHKLMFSQGFTDAHAFLPPKVAKAFGKRLQRDFGWVESKWKSYCKYLNRDGV